LLQTGTNDDTSFELPCDIGWDGEYTESQVRQGLEARQMFYFLTEEERNHIEEKIMQSPQGCVEFHAFKPLPSYIPVTVQSPSPVDVGLNPLSTTVFYGTDQHGITSKLSVGTSTRDVVTLFEFIDDAFIDHAGNTYGATVRVYGLTPTQRNI
jgi:hypothetical protein